MLVYLKPGGLPRLQALINQRTVAQAISVEGGFQKLEDLTGSGKELGLLVAVIILLLSFSAVASMMIGRFESMNVQMAVLRALGYSKKELAQMLIYEAVILTLLACVLGAAIDGFLFPWLRTLLGANVPSTEVVSMALWQSWPVWVTVLVGNLVSVLYPIWRISKQNIHLSLRSL
jgi:ABC-type lipoprotein release transport system permease subunit